MQLGKALAAFLGIVLLSLSVILLIYTYHYLNVSKQGLNSLQEIQVKRMITTYDKNKEAMEAAATMSAKITITATPAPIKRVMPLQTSPSTTPSLK